MTSMDAIVDNATLRAAIHENQDRPGGSAQVVAAEEIAERAAAIGEQAHVEALVHLIRSHYNTDEPERMLVPFATLVRLWDENPGWFDDWDTHAFFWAFKWATSDMLKIPGVPLRAIEDWLAQMDRRYRAAGHTPRAPLAYEFAVASHIGDKDRAQRVFDAWLAAERDQMSDCQACEVSDEGDWRLDCGDDAAALRAWAPVLAGDLTCAEEPHRILAKSLLPLVREGRIDEARANHLRGYGMIRDSEKLVSTAMLHIEFCTLTGNEARALELLAERPARFEADTADTRMDVFTTTAVLMERLIALGRGDLLVPGPRGRSWTAQELSEHARSEASRLAALFDERNGTSAVGDRMRESLARRPLVARLRLGLRSVLPDEVSPEGASPGGVTTEEAGGPQQPDVTAGPQGETEKGDIPGEVSQALGRLEKAVAEDDLNGMRSALTEALDHAGTTASVGWRAAMHLNLSTVLHRSGELAPATHHAFESVALADLDDTTLAAAARCRLAALLLQQQRSSEAAPVLEQAIPDLDAARHGEEMVASAHQWLGDCHAERGAHADAAREYLAATQLTETWDDQERHAQLARQAADALGRAGRLSEAAAAYRRATTLWESVGQTDEHVRSLRAHAWLIRADDIEQASHLMLDATRVCEEHTADLGTGVLAETLFQHARLVTHDDTADGRSTGLFPGALELAVTRADRAEVLARAMRDGEAEGRRSVEHGGEHHEGAEPSPATVLDLWARTALLAGELALVTGGTDRAVSLAQDVERAYPETPEGDWPRGYCGWIRSEAGREGPARP
ncbi:hypothetical protein [Myceligenerans indicum]|uniref:Tetratricopeptide repeat protein n=1 Tax=Myceligenerans indicum TaxID=2593663 RepID=A0ABS1LJU5_9MICO|nr:hypothetical protein [Myceligenerans indicum]MBL0886515.1 hypothetical protein [Myceligenerans indicum]